MFDDAIKTIKAQLYDRITSPLFGTFLMSWLGWNWHLPALFLFDSSMRVVGKFEYVSTKLYVEQSTYWIQGLLYPILTTIFFIGIYPWLARPVYGYWRHQQNKQKELQQKIDDETLMTVEEARELRRSVIESKLIYQAESDQREDKIKELEEIIKQAKLNTSAEKLTNQNEPPLPKKYKDDETAQGMFETLAKIGNFRGSVDKDILTAQWPNEDRLRIEHYIDLLREDDFIKIAYGKLNITPKGRAALVNKGFDVQ